MSLFPDRLKELMDESELSVEKLGEILNAPVQTIYRWLRGDGFPVCETLVEIADYFLINLDYLMGISEMLNQQEFRRMPPFGSRLANFVKEKGENEYRFCKNTRTSRSVYRGWLQHRHLPGFETLLFLSHYFDCSVDHLLGREP